MPARWITASGRVWATAASTATGSVQSTSRWPPPGRARLRPSRVRRTRLASRETRLAGRLALPVFRSDARRRVPRFYDTPFPMPLTSTQSVSGNPPHRWTITPTASAGMSGDRRAMARAAAVRARVRGARLDPSHLRDGEEYWELFSTSYGPTKSAAEALDDERRDVFHQTWVDFFEERREGDEVVHHREWLLTQGTRR